MLNYKNRCGYVNGDYWQCYVQQYEYIINYQNSTKFKLIKTKAQANEFLYYKLKEIGLVTQIDENIGVELLDLERIFS